MIEAVMLVALGFLCASLLALAAVPALARRADRLARRRAEAAFPLSLAEIAADRDHLRAELALRERRVEQKAETGFAARASSMEAVGRRDMTIAQLGRDLGARDATIAALEGELSTTRAELAATAETLAGESAALAATGTTLAERLKDLADIERNLAETRTALTGTGSDLDARTTELANERATLGRIEAVLAGREAELAQLRGANDGLRVAQVENRTQILVLEGKRDELSGKLSASERGLAETVAGLKAMTVDRDSERLRADALAARAAQAEAGLAAADASSGEAMAATGRLETQIRQQGEAQAADALARQGLERDLAQARAALAREQARIDVEASTLREDLREREQALETVHAQVQTLQGALAQARSDRARFKREIADLRKKAPGAETGPATAGNAALRQEITRIAERLMTLPPKQEAAE